MLIYQEGYRMEQDQTFATGSFPKHLAFKILVGMVLGLLVGSFLAVPELNFIADSFRLPMSEWLSLPGKIFIGLLKMVIIPLVLCSVILGIATGHDIAFLKRLGLRLVLYFLMTTAIAISIGMTIVNLVQPGQYISKEIIQTVDIGEKKFEKFDDLTIPQRILNILPTNITAAAYHANMLQIVVFAILLGVICVVINGPKTKVFLDLCTFGQAASMQVVSWAMYIAPIAVFGLLVDITTKVGLTSLLSVGAYVICVIAGLFMMIGVYCLIIRFLGRMNPIEFLASIRSAQLLAFSTSSSASVIPVSIHNAEEKLKLRPEISRFVIPLGATINMDGTAMYQGIAAVFLTQVFGIDLSFWELLALLITTIGASIGTPGTPGVGLVVLATILAGIGVPTEGIALLLGVDRILDMCRTTVNVTGDLTASVVMNRFVHHVRAA